MWDVGGASESLNIPQVFAISSQAADSLRGWHAPETEPCVFYCKFKELGLER